jgi:peptidoglycan hydrolase-like protein with peptidoglycan-binding domain
MRAALNGAHRLDPMLPARLGWSMTNARFTEHASLRLIVGAHPALLGARRRNDPELKLVQQALINMGHLARGRDDGTLGDKTERAVRAFHKAHSQMGPGTRNDPGLKAVQRALIDMGMLAEGQDDGTWGKNTRDAIVRFQSYAGRYYPDIGVGEGYAHLDRATLLALDVLAPPPNVKRPAVVR